MKTWQKALIAGAVAAAVTVPSAAWALPRLGAGAAGLRAGVAGAVAKDRATIAQDRAALLRDRITLALQRRKLRFDRVSTRVGNHIARIGKLADTVATKGGDVSKVKDLLSQAQSKLDAAKTTEQQSVDAFKAVPGSADKRSAFQGAIDIAKQAVSQLKDARQLTKQAAQQLKAVADGLKSSESTGTAQ